jgi:hypothetical protein
MINTINLIVIFIAHYLGDFICQSRLMANHKHRNYFWLATHGAVYSAVMFFLMMILTPLTFWPVLAYVLTNGLLHVGVDKISSFWSGYFYRQKKTYQMFNVIGLDQLTHSVMLIITYFIFFQ